MHLRSIINLKQNIMKNLFLFLTVIAVTFQSCSSDGINEELISEDPVVSQTNNEPSVSDFAGTWRGFYNGDDSGTWVMVIDDEGTFLTGVSYSNNGQISQPTISTTINPDGSTTSTAENGTITQSQITGNIIKGTWYNPNNNLRGTLKGSRE